VTRSDDTEYVIIQADLQKEKLTTRSTSCALSGKFVALGP